MPSSLPPLPPDWPAIARTLYHHPLPASLGGVDRLVAGALAQLDLWLYDYSLGGVRSLRSGAQGRLARGAGMGLDRWEGMGGALRAPLSHHGHLLGFVTAEPVGEAGPDGAGQRVLDELAPLLAAAVTTSDCVTDAVAIARRRRPMSLAAEMQWSMLPPTRFETDGWVVSAAVEPAYETGGDVFDYAERDGHVILAVLDAMGHGLESALVSAAAIAGLRRARRAGLGLADMAAEIDTVIRALTSPDGRLLGRGAGATRSPFFVSAVLADIDVRSGQGFYLSAGHVAPVVIAQGELRELELVPALPLGLRVGSAISRPVVQPLALEPGQTLMLYSDGIVENRLADQDEPAGYERLSQLVAARLGAGGGPHPARDVVDALLSLTGPDLRDDATLVLAQYAP